MAQTKNLVVNEFALSEAVSNASSFMKETKGALRNNAKMLSYENQQGSLKRRLGSKIKAIMNAFASYERQVSIGIGRGVSINALVTKQAIKEIVEPYESYIRKELGSKSISQAIDKINEQRAKDLKRFGVNEEKKKVINNFFDWKIKTFVLPLQFIEVKLNELTGGKRKTIVSNSSKAMKVLIGTATEAEVINDAVEDHKEYVKRRAEERKAKQEEAAKEESDAVDNTNGEGGETVAEKALQNA